MKKFFLMLLILFICGIISADLCVAALQDQSILMNLERFMAYAYNETLFKDVFWSILYERLKLLGLLILILFTPLRGKIPTLLASVFSFVFGFFMMSCILSLGIVGIVVGIASILPHGLLYMAVILILTQTQQTKRYIRHEQIGRSVVTYGLTMILFVTGCVLETVMGVQFVPWIIRLSLV